jgi:hypothetical protein
VLVRLFIAVTNTQEKHLKRRKDLFWFMVGWLHEGNGGEMKHHGGEGRIEEIYSLNGSQEAGRNSRKGPESHLQRTHYL